VSGLASAEAAAEPLWQLPEQPYPGLRPFEAAEWTVFFGREAMADEVITHLLSQQFVVVHGDSGSGKSSLIAAGVLPRLSQQGARAGVAWATCSARPGEAPLGNFARALSTVRGPAKAAASFDAIRRALNFGRHGAEVLAAELRSSVESPVCVLVDQFEELFAFSKQNGSEDARLLVEVLCGIQERRGAGLYAVLTMRSEFLGACAQFPGFAEVVNATQYLLPRMEHSDLVRAIREPATLFGGSVSLDLAERLMSDASGHQDQLPLIQHGLMLLHRNLLHGSSPHGAAGTGGTDSEWKLGVEDYERLGPGLSHALSEHADETLRAACAADDDPVAAEAVVERAFRALTDINADGQAVRRPQTLGALLAVTGSSEKTLRTVVDVFRAPGASFLKPYPPAELALDTPIDISHESLIRCWRSISDPERGWLIREFKNGLIWRSLLVQAESFERDPSNLLSPAASDERSAWIAQRNAAWSERYGGGWGRVQRLIDASCAERDRQRREELEERENQRRNEEAALHRAHERKFDEERLDNARRRVRAYRAGFFVALLLIMLASGFAVLAQRARAEAERVSAQEREAREAEKRARALAEEAQQKEATARLEAQQQLEATKLVFEQATEREQRLTEAMASLQQTVAGLSVAASLPTAQLRKAFSQAKGTLETDVDKISNAAKVPPRLYLHISDEAQRAAALQLVARLDDELGESSLVVPGIELRAYARTELRCFRPADCVEARALVNAINEQLASTQVPVQDLSHQYANSKSLRDRHYELWFAPGKIELSQTK
jgi:energy-coupling factor transporter ATP-binding protein EcfA2